MIQANRETSGQFVPVLDAVLQRGQSKELALICRCVLQNRVHLIGGSVSVFGRRLNGRFVLSVPLSSFEDVLETQS